MLGLGFFCPLAMAILCGKGKEEEDKRTKKKESDEKRFTDRSVFCFF